MNVGLGLLGISPRRYPAVAAKAEELGFESCWQSEHLIWPATMPPQYPYTEDGMPPVVGHPPIFDPWVTLGSIAGATSRIRLGTNIFILPLRHPIITARAVTTLDFISNGRVILGCGVGWLESEFRALGLDPRTRGRRTDEAIVALKKLWTGEVVSHDGEFYPFEDVHFTPRPVQRPHPPIIIGGDSRAALRRAAELGDGWIAIGRGADEAFGDRVQQLHRMRQACGRGAEPFEVTIGAGPNPTVDSIRKLEAAGATRVTMHLAMQGYGSPSVEQASAMLEDIAERILRHLD